MRKAVKPDSHHARSNSSWLNNSFSSASEILQSRRDDEPAASAAKRAGDRKICPNIIVSNEDSSCNKNNVSSKYCKNTNRNDYAMAISVGDLDNTIANSSINSTDRRGNKSSATSSLGASELKRSCEGSSETSFLSTKKSKTDEFPNMEEDGHESFMESDTLLESIDLMFEAEDFDAVNRKTNVQTPDNHDSGEVTGDVDLSKYRGLDNDSAEIFDDSESFTLSQLGFSQRLREETLREHTPQILRVHTPQTLKRHTSQTLREHTPQTLREHTPLTSASSELRELCVSSRTDVLCRDVPVGLQSSVTEIDNNVKPHSSDRLGSVNVCRSKLTKNDTPMSCSSIEFIVESKAPRSDCSTERNSRGCISSRLKQRLQRNARADTPVTKSRVSAILTDRPAESTSSSSDTKCIDITPVGNIGWCGEYDIGPFYGLPSKVQQLLKSHRSISDLYDWQKECLSMDAARNGRNLIYALPTSGGKTLVAELLIFQQLLCKRKDALLILPFVAIVQEKVRGLSPFAIDLDFIVEEYAASKGTFPPRRRLKRKSVYIATIEKANSLVNSLIEAKRIDQLGLVVVDELHMLGESGSRGALLEMTLTKLLYVSPRTQIVGMSATLSNIADLQKFLNADLYTNDFRPVELKEFVKLSDVLYEIDTKALCDEDRFKFSKMISFPTNDEKKRLDPDQLIDMVLEVVPQHSCLIFCPTKKNCENVAQLLCKLMPRSLREVRIAERRSLRSALQLDCAGKICPILRDTVMYGVAYHHSGLTMDERRLLEEAYLDGVLCVLACTSTLAAGVNLPAKRVILRSPYVGSSFISRSQYKQMVGRAGRAGLDSSGESILILTNKDKSKLTDLISSPQGHCLSNLVTDSCKGLRSILLAGIALKILSVREDIESLLSHTLCHVQQDKLKIDMKEMSCSALQQLVSLGLVVQRGNPISSASDEQVNQLIRLEITTLGNAVCKGSIDIDYGERLYADLLETQKCLVVDNYLHLLYLVTPYDMIDKVHIDWMLYHRELGTLSASELRVAATVGVSEALLVRRASGLAVRGVKDELPISRFYLTLMLLQLWKQKSIWDVAAKFKQPRGFIQQLLSSAGAFASCVLHFCRELVEFWAYQDLFENFVKKLSYCCSAELLPLMEIPAVKIGRARQLYAAGLPTLQHVARADPEHLVKNIEHLPRRVAWLIVTSAQMLLKEKAEALKEEAEILMTVSEVS